MNQDSSSGGSNGPVHSSDPISKLRSQQPQQNTFKFDKVVVSSDFDSGNLARCTQSSKNYFNMYISEDCLPYITNCGNYRTWFYFSVTGVQEGESLTFSIRNMNNQGKLYKSGLKPVYRVLPEAQKKWKRIVNNVNFDYASEGFYITFSHQFTYEPTDVVYFAFTYPYSYEETLRKSEKIYNRLRDSQNIYMHREILGQSIENRIVELLTITGRNKITNKKEELIDGLFPQNESKEDRPYIFDKPTVFLTSRVHPGETPASFVLNGILNFLTNESSEQAKILLDNFVFKVIPILNPDGVYRGYYRLDTKNQNLNRYYLDPSPQDQPTIWATKQAIMQQHNLGKLFLYVDLHAHASKKGCFMFGNHLTGEKQLKNMLLPKLISYNSLNFDFVECSFSEKMMNCRDKKDGLSREGSGRVAIYKATGIPLCYTLECNYASGRRLNHISAKLNKNTNQVEPESPITDVHAKMYQNGETKAPPYTIEIFEDVGRAFCIGLLDYIEKNPISRIPTSNLKSLDNIKNDLVVHNKIFIPRKLEDNTQQKSSTNTQKSVTQRKPQPLIPKKSTPQVKKQNTFSATLTKIDSEQIDKPLNEGESENIICELLEFDQGSHESKSAEDDEYFYQQPTVKTEESKQAIKITNNKPPQVPNKQLVRNISEKKDRIDQALHARRRQPVSLRSSNKSTVPSLSNHQSEEVVSNENDYPLGYKVRQQFLSNERIKEKEPIDKTSQEEGKQQRKGPLMQVIDQQIRNSKKGPAAFKTQNRSQLHSAGSRQQIKSFYVHKGSQILGNNSANGHNDSDIQNQKVVAPITNFRMPTPNTGQLDLTQSFFQAITPQDQIIQIIGINRINSNQMRLPDIKASQSNNLLNIQVNAYESKSKSSSVYNSQRQIGNRIKINNRSSQIQNQQSQLIQQQKQLSSDFQSSSKFRINSENPQNRNNQFSRKALKTHSQSNNQIKSPKFIRQHPTLIQDSQLVAAAAE